LELTTHRGVRVTTPVRTLVDLAAQRPLGRLELALNEALATKLVTALELDGRHAELTRLLREAPGYTRQEAERRLRRLILRAQFTGATFNVPLLGETVDVLFDHARLVIEVDGWATTAAGDRSSATAASTRSAPPRATGRSGSRDGS